MRYIVSIVLSVVLLLGCQTPPEPEKIPEPLPEWLTQIPVDSQVVLYGNASAATLKQAKAKALQQLAVKLNAQLAVNKTNSTDGFTQNVTIQPGMLVQYKLLQADKANEIYYVLLRLDTRELSDYIEQQLAQLYLRFTRHAEKRHTYPEFIWAQEAKTLIAKQQLKVKRLISLISLLGYSKQTEQALTAPLIAFKQTTEQAIARQCLKIETQDYELKKLFSAHLAELGIQDKYLCQQKLILTMSESTQLKQGQYLSSVNVQLQLTNANNRAYSQRQISTTGRSMASFYEARKAGLSKLKQQLDDRHIGMLLKQ